VGGAGADILLALTQGCGKSLLSVPHVETTERLYQTSRSVCKKIQFGTKIPPDQKRETFRTNTILVVSTKTARNYSGKKSAVDLPRRPNNTCRVFFSFPGLFYYSRLQFGLAPKI
jgi:hypothetical protein